MTMMPWELEEANQLNNATEIIEEVKLINEMLDGIELPEITEVEGFSNECAE